MGGIQLDGLIQYLQKAFPVYPDGNTADARLALEQFGTQNSSIQVLCDPVKQWSQGVVKIMATFTLATPNSSFVRNPAKTPISLEGQEGKQVVKSALTYQHQRPQP